MRGWSGNFVLATARVSGEDGGREKWLKVVSSGRSEAEYDQVYLRTGFCRACDFGSLVKNRCFAEAPKLVWMKRAG
jgi:hypothetical protein